MKRPRVIALVACVLVALASALRSPSLAAAPPEQRTRLADTSLHEPVWPLPPAPPRVRFVRSLDPATVQRPPSMFMRVLGAIVGAGGPPPTMVQPYGVAVGPDRRVYVADTATGRIHVYDVERRRYRAITVGRATSLVGVAFAAGRMFVTDSASDQVMGLDLDGHVLWSRGRSDGFERPTGLTASPTGIYVTDTLKHRVVRVDLNGTVGSTFGERGGGPGQFNYPTNITRGADGTLYVTDSMNFRVQVFDAQHRLVRTFGHLGDGSGDFTKPKGIAVTNDQRVYVVEGLHDVVQIFDDQGTLLLAFGGSGTGDGQLWLPTGIAIEGPHIYVVDSANRRVQMFDYVGPRG